MNASDATLIQHVEEALRLSREHVDRGGIPTHRETHRAALRTAETHRVSVAPTILIGDEHRIEGC